MNNKTLNEELTAKNLLQKVDHLDIRMRMLLENIKKGKHRSRKKGSTIEFSEYKEYAVFDEIRDIDWKIYGRNEKLYVKQREDEAKLDVIFILDKSNSMNYGSGEYLKIEYAKLMAALLSHLVLKNFDIATLKLYDERADYFFPSGSGKNYYFTFLESLNTITAEGKTDFKKGISSLKDRIKKDSVIFLFTDFLFDFEEPERLKTTLSFLNKTDNFIFLFHIADNDEIAFPFSDRYIFKGLEDPLEIEFLASDIKKVYLKLFKNFLQELKNTSTSLNMQYHLINTNSAFEEVIYKALEQIT